MASQRKAKKSNPAKSCKCDRCDLEAHSIPETTHRNCGGGPGASPRGYSNRLEGSKRGTWR
jgi:hypothetical protein